MSYKVLYRKYRPINFEQIIGQKNTVTILKNAIKYNKISHAYLFCGPKGTGKTTMAKIFAKAVNCESKNICNQCENCIMANSNNHPDIIEIDAASHTSVNEIRNIIENIKFVPTKGKYKVYIIDEVHMISIEAFNAFLKTLEEPLSHIIFILATTEPYKIPTTILSRCQRFNFTKINSEEMINYLKDVVLKEEKVKCENEALYYIAEMADGGLRDALSILDQLLTYSPKLITKKSVLELFNLVSIEKQIDLLLDIANKNTSSVLKHVTFFIDSGIDLDKLTDSIINILKELLIYQITKQTNLLKIITEKEITKLKSFFNAEQINKMIETLLKTKYDFKNISNLNSLFEITILKLIDIASYNINMQQNLIDNQDHQKEKKIKENSGKTKINEENNLNKLDDITLIQIITNNNKNKKKEISDKWQNELNIFLEQHPEFNNDINLLTQAEIFIINEKNIILSYEFEHLVQKINDKNNQKNLAFIIKKITNFDLFVYAIKKIDERRLIKLFIKLKKENQLPKIKK